MRNKNFDKEYSTQWPLEQLYLKECGIAPTFVKCNDGITIWKYRKDSILFNALYKFYRKREGFDHTEQKIL